MKFIAILTILSLIFACNPSPEQEQEDSSVITEITATLDTKKGSFFFDFDELIYVQDKRFLIVK